MREIKFRAWDGSQFIEHLGLQNLNVLHLSSASPYALQQYTGLKDNNGKEIYEGDVVYIKAFSPEKNIVRFDRGGFCLQPVTDMNAYFLADIKYAEDDRSEVIGNIYENPELLK